jgi:predicted lysophospholipase L1 biosynthesis ABC-type transport system permease subunit
VLARAVPDRSTPPLARNVTVTLRLSDLRVATGTSDTTLDTEPVDLAAATWYTDGSGADATARAGSLRLSATVPFGDSADLSALTFADPSAGSEQVNALVTPDVLSTLDASVGDPLQVAVGGNEVRLVIAGTVPYLPGRPAGTGVLVDADLLSRELLVAGSGEDLVDEWWLTVPDGRASAVAASMERAGTASVVVRAKERVVATDGPLHVGVQAALWIVVVAAIALAVSGLAMSAAVTVRSRRLEFARLQALGAPRSGLVRSVLVEHAILGTVGIVVGVALGALLAHVVAPLITTSATGNPPVPGVEVHWDWPDQLLLAGALAGLVALVVGVTTSTLLKRASGELLRLGDER